MRLERRFLRSKVARRIFSLFVLCALLPIVALSLISSGFVATELRDSSRESLHQKTKAMGMEVLSRLHSVESELQIVALLFDSGVPLARADGDRRLVERLAATFDGIAVVSNSGRVEHVVGEILPPHPDGDALRRLSEGKTHLSVGWDEGSRARVYLSQRLRDAGLEPRTLVGAIAPEYLVGLQQGISLPAQSELFLTDSSGKIMIRSLGDVSALPEEVRASIEGSTSGEFGWHLGETRYLGSYWSIFLNSSYGAPSWTIVLCVSRADVLAPLAHFGRLLPLVLLLCLCVVALLSYVQIRRCLVPIEKLSWGTERIAAREFDTRLSISSDDEFQQLAESFNSMAARLGRQFRTLTTLAEIDRAVLSTWKEESVVRTVLTRIPDHLPCQCVALTVVDARATDRARLYVRWVDQDRDPWNVDIRLTLDELVALSGDAADPRLLSDDQLPDHLESLTDSGIRHGLLVPIRIKQQPAGYFTLGYRTLPHHDGDDLVEAERLANQVAVALSNARLVEELEEANWETLRALARVVDANSPWTAGHSERVTEMAVRLARRLGLADDEIEVIHRGGLLHDIGKIGVPNEILDSPERLTDEQWEAVRSHVTIGARILEPISAYSREIPIVLYHHERYDGKGYPEGLAGERIPLHARILSVADVYDALISERPYRAGWRRGPVVEFIRDGSGTQFDPRVVSEFLDLMGECVDRQGGEKEARCVAAESA